MARKGSILVVGRFGGRLRRLCQARLTPPPLTHSSIDSQLQLRSLLNLKIQVLSKPSNQSFKVLKEQEAQDEKVPENGVFLRRTHHEAAAEKAAETWLELHAKSGQASITRL